jgi:hypothetical protein
MKKSILLSVMVLLVATVFISCEKEDAEFKVESIDPASGATNVKVDVKINLEFNKKPSAATIAGTGISLIYAKTDISIPASFTYDGDVTITIFPTIGYFAPEADLKIEIVNATAEDGSVLANFSSTFASEKPEFRILSITPANGSTNVKPDAKIVIIYSKKPSSITSFGGGCELYSAKYGIHTIIGTTDRFNTVTLTPKDKLVNGTEYFLKIKDQTSADGEAIPDVVHTFTVEK